MGRVLIGGAIAVVSSLLAASPARADGPVQGPNGPSGPNRESTQGDLKGKAVADGAKATGPAKPSKAALPVSLTIVAPTPDAPWTMKVENTGDHPIRIPGDVRLLSFDLEKKSGGTMKCSAPAGLRPSKFPNDRELYLKPGESFQQNFDPRLYCFNAATDALTGGTTVHPHYGFGGGARATGPFAAQGLDRPEEFAALPQIDGPTIVLSYRAVEPMGDASDSKDKPKDGSAPKKHGDTPDKTAPKDAPAGPAPLVSHAKGDKTDSRMVREPTAEEKAHDPYKYDRGASPQQAKLDDAPSEVVDLNKARVEVFVNRFADASAARDIMVNIKASNEGRRDLVTALRGRMISFSIEQLAPDGTTRKTVDCLGSEHPHGIPADLMNDIGAGQSASVPLMLAEICPPGTFNRPGLYRVLPRIDTSVDGEALQLHAFIGKALAKQSTLLRLATARDPFEDEAPKVATPEPPPDSQPAPASPPPAADSKKSQKGN